MKCSCCDKMLSDYEATRKNAETHQYLDLCNTCLDEVQDLVGFPVEDNPTLLRSSSELSRRNNTDDDYDVEGLDSI
jgi:hypothetical protein